MIMDENDRKKEEEKSYVNKLLKLIDDSDIIQ
jgi:hypothetical protein